MPLINHLTQWRFLSQQVILPNNLRKVAGSNSFWKRNIAV
jgi:hypothetical protein